MKALISYSSSDGEGIASKLEAEFKNQNVRYWISRSAINKSEMWLEEIDKALISEIDFVLGVITKDYLSSIGGKEAYATLSKQFRDGSIHFIPLFFIDPKEFNSVIIPALDGFVFTENFNDGLLKLLNFLKSKEGEDPLDILTKIENPHSLNPFRRVRTEFFYEDFKLLANAFAEPEREMYELIQEAKPVIIFGGRGSGKTMILQSLIPEVISSRFNYGTFNDITNHGTNYFGLYFKLERGSLLFYDNEFIVRLGFLACNLELNYDQYLHLIEISKTDQINEHPIIKPGMQAAIVISINELNLKILKTVLSKIKKFQTDNFIKLERSSEEKISKKIISNLDETIKNQIRTFDDLLDFIKRELNKINQYIQDISLPNSTPKVNWCKTKISFLDEIFEILSDEIPDFSNIRYYLLFDEYENLCSFQQVIINEWIKTSKRFTVKIASKFDGMYTTMTLQGQPLQDGQDYFSWQLDYNLFDQQNTSQYQKLLIEICSKLLKLEGFNEQNLSKILAEPEIELPYDMIDEEIRKIRTDAQLEYDESKIANYRDKLEVAVIFRLLRKREKIPGRKRRKKIYAGFETYTYLSSGIIRIFLNLLGMAYYKAEGEGINIKQGEKIPVQAQTWAAYKVSQAWLEKIPDNVEENGEKMYQLIVDLGDIFRERLLFHPSEPETLVINLKDPYNLKNNHFLNKIISHSVMESIFYERKATSSTISKQLYDSKSKQYVLNRIFSPILKISHRARWARGCEFSTSELTILLEPNNRQNIKKEIMQRQHKEGDTANSSLDYFG
jgi:hypothetical protein